MLAQNIAYSYIRIDSIGIDYFMFKLFFYFDKKIVFI